MEQINQSAWPAAVRLFATSFAALFLELMVIRWVPSEVRLVAYYANLMLVSSFLGLGAGAMVAGRNWGLFRFFFPLLLLNVLLLLLLAFVTLPGGSGEWRFQESNQKIWAYLMLVAIFVVNAGVFVPLGEEIGKLFHLLPSLRAYSWDLGGSLCGTLFFGAFSLLRFSPVVGMALVVVIVGVLSDKKRRLIGLPLGVIAVAAMFFAGQRGAYWSPYYFITVHENYLKTEPAAVGQQARASIADRPAQDAPAEVRTMKSPPVFTVRVNQDFYQMHGTLDSSRYQSGTWQMQFVLNLFAQYSLPHQLVKKVDRVLVLGAGGGMDVETALLNGAKRVDAVEIDPVIPKISNRFSAAAPYARSDVVLHIDDARAFLQKCTDSFDLVVFGFLDSQALFSYGASLRLDGYTYTVESFRKAYERVNEGGVMVVSFFVGREWMAQKLVQMIEQATGQLPLTYVQGGKLIMIVPRGQPARVPSEFFGWQLARIDKEPVDLATDDWPYLYLEKKGVPTDYIVVIGLLLLVSIAAILTLRGAKFGLTDAHFLFMGWGFLLLQTKSIGDCSLYFGTTWFVTTLVITGVLLMVLLANWVAIAFIRKFSPWFYVPLFASLAMLLLMPRETILAQSFSTRLLWTLLAVPLPVFFAGLIFSTTFREGGNPSAMFGANLIGATIGGFCEYLGMWTGSQALSYIVMGAYVASLISVVSYRRGGGAPAPAIAAGAGAAA